MNATTQTHAELNATSPTTFAAFKAESSISFIRNYDPKVTDIAGYRHAVIRYRTDKNTAAKPAKMVTVPVVAFPDEYGLLPAKAMQVFTGIIEGQQDTIIRESIDSGANLITWDSVSLDNCLEALTAARIANYLTKEDIANWVTASLSVQLTERGEQIAEAKGFDADKTKQQVAATINSYRDNFSKLAAKVPNIGMEVAQALQNQLTLANLADDMAKRLGTKLHNILNPAAASDDL